MDIDKIRTGLLSGFLFQLHDLLFVVTGVGNVATSFFNEARKKKQVISHSIVQGENCYSGDAKTKKFIKSGVSYISNATCPPTTNLETYLPLIKSLHKINCCTPFMYQQSLTPITITIDACNPVDDIQMCLIDCPSPSIGRVLNQTLLKEAVYNQVQNLGVPRTQRVLTLAAPRMSCVVKLSVKSRECGINIWFHVTVHQASIPQLFIPKHARKRKPQESPEDGVHKYAKAAEGNNIPADSLQHEILDFGQNELINQNAWVVLLNDNLL